MLCNSCNKLQRTVGLKITFIAAMVYLRTVDGRTGFLKTTQLGQGKGVSDDVLAIVAEGPDGQDDAGNPKKLGTVGYDYS